MARRRPRADEPALPVDGSWRMVEGEHDSFDTAVLPSVGDADDDDDDDVLAPLSGRRPPSRQPSSSQPSQRSSRGTASSASQDSIRDFAKHQDDDHVILREPFRPSMLVAPRTPDPQFRMPRVDAAAGPGSRSGSSSRTLRPVADDGLARRRARVSLGSPARTRQRRPRPPAFDNDDDDDDDDDDGLDDGHAPAQYRRRFVASLHTTKRRAALAAAPSALYRLCAWASDVLLIALAYAKYPLAALVAVYLVLGGLVIAQNMATRSLHAAVSPLCRVPGAALLGLPFCPPARQPAATPAPAVEFDDLVSVQSHFEQVLDRSADGVSLPFEMKRSEAAVRDLRTLVRHSDLQARHELLLEFDGYIDVARRAAADLQRFNTHVGSAVDAVISINRWTARYIDSLAPDAVDGPPSALAAFASFLLSPFQPAADQPFSERAILDKYMEHTALVSDRISALILEAQAVLRLLAKAEDHLSLIYDITSRSSASVSSRRDEMLWTLWTLVGANNARLHNLSQQLVLLRQVDGQRTSAVEQVSALVLELEAMQAGLGDLRDRVSEPELVGASRVAHVPLSVHIETIDRGVERLQAARARIRAAEDERVRDAVARAGIKSDEDRLIDARVS